MIFEKQPKRFQIYYEGKKFRIIEAKTNDGARTELIKLFSIRLIKKIYFKKKLNALLIKKS